MAAVVVASGCGNGVQGRQVGEGAPLLAAGDEFVCAAGTSLGRMVCWGHKRSVRPDSHVYRILATSRTTLCGLTVDGQVDCREVRRSAEGEVQIGVSVPITSLAGASDIAMDFDGLCAVVKGVRRCLRFPVERSAPIDGPRGVRATTGPRGGCVLKTEGEVECDHWGGLFTPRTIALVEPAVKVVATEQRGCALLVSGRVACWMNTGLGSDGRPDGGGPAILRSEFDGVADIAISTGTVCAVLTHSRGVACSGADYYGLLGDGTYSESGDLRIGARVKRSEGITRLVGGDGAYFCGSRQTLEVTCWGFNMFGVLGTANRRHTGPNTITLPGDAGSGCRSSRCNDSDLK